MLPYFSSIDFCEAFPGRNNPFLAVSCFFFVCVLNLFLRSCVFVTCILHSAANNSSLGAVELTQRRSQNCIIEGEQQQLPRVAGMLNGNAPAQNERMGMGTRERGRRIFHCTPHFTDVPEFPVIIIYTRELESSTIFRSNKRLYTTKKEGRGERRTHKLYATHTHTHP